MHAIGLNLVLSLPLSTSFSCLPHLTVFFETTSSGTVGGHVFFGGGMAFGTRDVNSRCWKALGVVAGRGVSAGRVW